MRAARSAARLALASLALGLVAGTAGCSGGPAAPEGVGAPTGCDGPPRIGSSAELRVALAEASPGDVLVLAEGRYDGRFRATVSGTAERPVTLCGPAGAVLDGGSTGGGYTLHLEEASYWRLVGFSVTGAQKGLVLDGASHNRVVGLRISGTGQEGLHLRTGSSDNLVARNRVWATGLVDPGFGEGVYVGSARSNWCELTDCEPDRSDGNRVVGNRVWGTGAEAVDIKEGTRGGVLRGNRLRGGRVVDSVVDLKGNGWVVAGNRIVAPTGDGVQVHVVAPGWGRRNAVRANDVTAPAGLAVDVVGAARAAGTVVACDQGPRTPTGRVTNVACR
ncbi:hypothetical protein GGQ22_07645 [Nocardioides sp. zg-579]|uniref:Right handed beta helix domain-containing protein n=1 Tax=Nocardioides marmotae TaxID=2663857 RepID=A0A6I3J318_9ACTN|nr:hypothetical protein [Nocardioides marmotae]MCR6031317.1 hypothetical protein [Gordonia jinghuaiqii]MTB94956.1 hypothetical protein [Nocardioides marmotae]QKE02533.1 hypothetical protein HPC71_16765 [Nocardioides marmotae]